MTVRCGINLRLLTAASLLVGAAAAAAPLPAHAAPAPAPATPAWTNLSAQPGPRLDATATLDPVTQQAVLTGGCCADYVASYGDTWTFGTTGWSSPSIASPPARTGAGSAFDSDAGSVVIFGGFQTRNSLTPGVDLADTWTWNGAAWTMQTPAVSPPPRVSPTMAYDAVHHQVVMFGGFVEQSGSTMVCNPPPYGCYTDYFTAGPGPALSDTWTWDGSTWTQQHPAHSPAARAYASMATEPAGSIMLFGGENDAALEQGAHGYAYHSFADTWRWDGTDWTQLAPTTSPSTRRGAALTFDPARHADILFGGTPCEPNCGSTNVGGVVGQPYQNSDTWSWDGTTWTQLKPAASPAGRERASLFALNGRDIMVGGGPGTGFGEAGLEETWSFDGATWTNITPPIPPLRDMATMAYDAARHQDVLFGGRDAQTAYGDTWTWDGSRWTNQNPLVAPPARREAAMAYFPPTQSTILFGGEGASQTQYQSDPDAWSWNGSVWTPQLTTTAPPKRRAETMAYDAVHQKLVLFGGYDTATGVLGQTLSAGANYADTWTWDGTSWTQQHPAHVPPSRGFASEAWDPASQRVILFGGVETNSDNTLTTLGDTWAWDGVDWIQLSPAHHPSPRVGAALGTDTADAGLVLNGGIHWHDLGQPNATPLSDTWFWNGSDWVLQQTVVSPPPRVFQPAAEDPTGGVTIFGGTDGGYFGDSTWHFATTALAPVNVPEVPLLPLIPLIGAGLLAAGLRSRRLRAPVTACPAL